MSLDDLRSAARRGALRCAFGSGTAARLALIRAIGTLQGEIEVADNGQAQKLATQLKAAQEGSSPDRGEWRVAA